MRHHHNQLNTVERSQGRYLASRLPPRRYVPSYLRNNSQLKAVVYSRRVLFTLEFIDIAVLTSLRVKVGLDGHARKKARRGPGF
ncbi:hypothetical protein [Roseateles noduli]|uniref:hypothetical protein n=1 Tax=Roseateles noduli TaxID=2052484 RepID=UPI003D654AE8